MKILLLMLIMLSFISFWNYALSEKMEELLDQNQQAKFVTVKDDRFIATDGRQIILHGVNIVEKNKEINYLSWHGAEEFAKMREWGFNCIRLGVIWDGVEPEPGKYDDDYLAGLDKRIQWAKDNGIYVILDMHQDLFSAKFGGDGAPAWAVLDEGKPHIHRGGVWSEAYFTSPAVQTAFDNFWENKPVSDGVGVQDHFAMMWQHVAKRYANEPTVIGYDLFNEPFPGSSILTAMSSKLKSALKVIAKKQGKSEPTDAEITQVLMQPELLMTYAENIDNYRAFCDGDNSLVWQFENTILASFYKRVSASIRQIDKNHIIFLETHIVCNGGTPTGITPILDKNGDKVPLQALAPHGYDIYTDTDKVANASYERIKLIFDRHSEASKRWQMPVIIGEWGGFYGQDNTLPAAQMVVKQFEKHLFGDTYWSYGSNKEINEAPYFKALARPYPSNISGTLLSYRSDLDNITFSCSWEEDPSITTPTRIYVPIYWFSDKYSVELDPDADDWSIEKISGDDSSFFLVIPSSGQAVERKITIQALPSTQKMQNK